MRQNQK